MSKNGGLGCSLNSPKELKEGRREYLFSMFISTAYFIKAL